MAFELTPRFQLPQWTSDDDAPTRQQFNSAFAQIDAVAAAQADMDTTPQKYAQTIGDGTATQYTVTHGLGTRDLTWSIRDLTSNEFGLATVVADSDNTLLITFDEAPAASSLRVTVIA